MDTLPPEEHLISWRLGRVEKALEELDKKFDSMNEVKETQIGQSKDIAYLMKSRDRFMVALSTIGTGVLLLLTERLIP